MKIRVDSVIETSVGGQECKKVSCTIYSGPNMPFDQFSLYLPIDNVEFEQSREYDLNFHKLDYIVWDVASQSGIQLPAVDIPEADPNENKPIIPPTETDSERTVREAIEAAAGLQTKIEDGKNN